MLTFGSLFAGIGGFDLGFELAGMACRWQVENDKRCIQTLERHFPSSRRIGDVAGWTPESSDAVDVVCGGWPCQDLSVAGKRAGLSGERSGLFYEFVRVVSELRPAWVVGENVPGLLSSASGADMQSVITSLADLGYCVCWRVLDAQFFGVPQRRRRVFFVCHSDPHRAAAVLFESEGGTGNPAKMRETGSDIAGTLGGGSGSRGWCDDLDRCGAYVHTLRADGHDAGEDGTGRGTPLVAACLQSRIGKGGFTDPVNDNIIAVPAEQPLQQQRPDDGGGDACAFNIVGGGQQGRNHAYATERTGAIQSKGNSASGNEAGTIVCAPSNSDGMRALPGLPGSLDVFACPSCAEGPDSPRYRQIGNAVVPAVAEWIGRRIIEASLTERV